MSQGYQLEQVIECAPSVGTVAGDLCDVMKAIGGLDQCFGLGWFIGILDHPHRLGSCSDNVSQERQIDHLFPQTMTACRAQECFLERLSQIDAPMQSSADRFWMGPGPDRCTRFQDKHEVSIDHLSDRFSGVVRIEQSGVETKYAGASVLLGSLLLELFSILGSKGTTIDESPDQYARMLWSMQVDEAIMFDLDQ
jgi:hypothetical protein